MSKLDLLTVSSGSPATLISSIATSGSVSDSRLWEGDDGKLYVYNLKDELWMSSDGGATWTNKYPSASNTVSYDSAVVGRQVSAITQYLVEATPTSGSSDTTVICISAPALNGTTHVYSDTQLDALSQPNKWLSTGFNFYDPPPGANEVSYIVDMIEDANGTAGILFGNSYINMTRTRDGARILRSDISTNGEPGAPVESDTGLMATFYTTTSIGGLTITGYEPVAGVTVTDLEIATS